MCTASSFTRTNEKKNSEIPVYIKFASFADFCRFLPLRQRKFRPTMTKVTQGNYSFQQNWF